MYDQQLSTPEFLRTTYILMRKKIRRLQEINTKVKKNKLPLPLLKEKYEITSKVLEALKLLVSMIDFEKPEAEELNEILRYVGYRISLGNNKYSDSYYQNAIDVLDAFLEEPEL